jgi:hypothetical protein
MEKAKSDLLRKMDSTWNPLIFQGMPLLPCYAAAGNLLQFHAIVPDHASKPQLHPISEVYNLDVPSQRLHVMGLSIRMYAVLVLLRTAFVGTPIPLYRRVSRTTCTICIHDTYVSKLITKNPAPDTVYERLERGVPCAITVKRRVRTDSLIKLRITPVCTIAVPQSEQELKRGIHAVLTALAAWHSDGLVHRDIRWGNVLVTVQRQYLLSDFDNANVDGAPVTWANEALPPESQGLQAFTWRGDIWMVGRLVVTWPQWLARQSPAAAPAVLSAEAKAWADRLMFDDASKRPAAQALLSSASLSSASWLKV